MGYAEGFVLVVDWKLDMVRYVRVELEGRGRRRDKRE
jgi:hypothetical protein